MRISKVNVNKWFQDVHEQDVEERPESRQVGAVLRQVTDPVIVRVIVYRCVLYKKVIVYICLKKLPMSH